MNWWKNHLTAWNLIWSLRTVVDRFPRAVLCSAFAKDINRNVLLEFVHIFLPLWGSDTVWHNPSHQLWFGQCSHLFHDVSNTGRLRQLTKVSVRRKYIGIPPIGHRPVKEAGKSCVVKIIMGGGFKKEVDIALFQRPSKGTLHWNCTNKGCTIVLYPLWGHCPYCVRGRGWHCNSQW